MCAFGNIPNMLATQLQVLLQQRSMYDLKDNDQELKIMSHA
jgi:hypothetical protein